MTYTSIAISSGHGKHVRGASGIIDEVEEARKVTEKLAGELIARGVAVNTFHDDTSKSQNENLNTIVNWHNKQKRELDVSVHFNAYEQVSKPMGVEVLYVTQQTLAAKVSSAIAASGFINRGAKKRTDLFFLNKTSKPSILLEICFVDSEADVSIYDENFDAICADMADILGGDVGDTIPPIPSPPSEMLFHAVGRCSYFGGPEDMGVSDDEGLAFIYEVEDAPFLFLPECAPGTENKGLARKLNPFVHYVACRWDYNVTPKKTMLNDMALVRAVESGLAFKAFPADWGPHQNTGRVADLSPSLMDDLGISTDDEVEVIFPYRED
jgi:N-acetylmuramoyl-L-alanine amidase